MEEILKLLLAMLVGGIIGVEREYRDKSAGFRTILLITVGSTLFTILSLDIGVETNPTRIAANIVTGVGFLGAGAILREGHRITGLTTAATIWMAAALGMGIGVGKYALVGVATGLTLIALWLFPALETWLDQTRETVTYEISLPVQSPRRRSLMEMFRNYGIRIYHQREIKTGDILTLTLRTAGRRESHRKLVEALLQDPEVIEVKY
ncbi:MAG: MgtC/SapB family protein [Anaerolineae bacterium]|nr:MgtC/SapB family protein [Anaerolineae bacterium]MCX8067903.1 MgtC/SapB family protein [Anaerolineae bacterium]MDW7991328.1 MgtC/SapB family protein [Anaerolineae bacterium]